MGLASKLLRVDHVAGIFLSTLAYLEVDVHVVRSSNCLMLTPLRMFLFGSCLLSKCTSLLVTSHSYLKGLDLTLMPIVRRETPSLKP